MNNPYDTLTEFKTPNGEDTFIYSLKKLEQQGHKIAHLPVSIRILLESVMRNCDGHKITTDAIDNLVNWNPKDPGMGEVPFVVSRIVLQDFTGVPLLVDLAAMRDAVSKMGKDVDLIEPLVPVDLVIDHSVQVDFFGSDQAYERNLKRDFERNRERYEFLKWGQEAFETLRVLPPAAGIVHQVNLEYLARLVFDKEIEGKTVLYPDSLVGTDSHTTMINGLGIMGWGVGGIEAEAGMLGQPIYIQTPEVIGVHLTGKLNEGVTATDLTLRITEILRKENVVGKFVEFHGEGAQALSVVDRATISNMAPEYGATMGFFPVDEKSIDYMLGTGRTQEQIDRVKAYYQEQNLWGMPKKGEIQYTKVVELDLGSILPAVAGPKRPQDRINVPELKKAFDKGLTAEISSGGFGKQESECYNEFSINEEPYKETPVKDGSVLIAAITSCTNTSNPSVMIGAGLVAKKAAERGLKINPLVKTSLAPGSRVVTEYLEKADLQKYFDKLGFHLVGYGCTTCIGNSGPLDEPIENTVKENQVVAASVLSGNRNFEARVHPSIKANYLMSPPLVVAYALAGRVNIDLSTEPLGQDSEGKDVFLKDIWPTHSEINNHIKETIKPEIFLEKYSEIQDVNPEWNEMPVRGGATFQWNNESTYIQNPPFFEGFSLEKPKQPVLKDMRPIAILGDSVTTDHISPAGAIADWAPAGQFLIEKGVEKRDFNSYGSRRGNDRIMTRGTFANVRIKNKMANGNEGGFTKHMPDGEEMSIFDACEKYKESGTPLIVFAGCDYGMGSSRDWAAKGTSLLGIKVVVAESFERIHRSNLIGMGVLPLQFPSGTDIDSLKLDGSEIFSIENMPETITPAQNLTLSITRKDGSTESVELLCRIDTLIESHYYQNGGILPYVLKQILSA